MSSKKSDDRAPVERGLQKLNTPDFSKMKCEHPSPDTAAAMAEADEKAKDVYSVLNAAKMIGW